LAEPVAQAQGADGGRQVQMSATMVARHGHHHGWRYQDGLGFRFLVQGRVTAPAIIIGCAELDQQAVIASYDFPRIYRGKSRGHRVVGVPERATPCNVTACSLTAETNWGRYSDCRVNLRHLPCGSQD
jgi:hypothetical protein